MSKVYRSPYEAYPFLADNSEDLRCDFEILTDKLCSGTGLLCAMIKENNSSTTSLEQNKTQSVNHSLIELVESLTKLGELIYHLNPSLRTFCSITEEEVIWLKSKIDALREEFSGEGFVLPHGSKEACLSHCLRTEGKELVRLLYRYIEQGHQVSNILIDFTNLVSGYFFTVSLYINYKLGIEEIPFKSRNYK